MSRFLLPDQIEDLLLQAKQVVPISDPPLFNPQPAERALRLPEPEFCEGFDEVPEPFGGDPQLVDPFGVRSILEAGNEGDEVVQPLLQPFGRPEPDPAFVRVRGSPTPASSFRFLAVGSPLRRLVSP